VKEIGAWITCTISQLNLETEVAKQLIRIKKKMYQSMFRGFALHLSIANILNSYILRPFSSNFNLIAQFNDSLAEVLTLEER
jgi:hypothetical protein